VQKPALTSAGRTSLVSGCFSAESEVPHPKSGELLANRAKVAGAMPAGKGTIAMANILVNIEKGIEIAAEDVLKWLGGANKALKAAPQVVAALATLIAAVEKPMAELAGVAANPLNIALDIQTAKDLKAVMPEVKAFLATLGVKF
jgi:hypothetical protein